MVERPRRLDTPPRGDAGGVSKRRLESLPGSDDPRRRPHHPRDLRDHHRPHPDPRRRKLPPHRTPRRRKTRRHPPPRPRPTPPQRRPHGPHHPRANRQHRHRQPPAREPRLKFGRLRGCAVTRWIPFRALRNRVTAQPRNPIAYPTFFATARTSLLPADFNGFFDFPRNAAIAITAVLTVAIAIPTACSLSSASISFQ